MNLNFESTGVYENIKKPCRSTIFSAGYDLFLPVKMGFAPNTMTEVDLGIRWKPERMSLAFRSLGGWGVGGVFAKVWERSGHARKYYFKGHAGIIDQDYLDPWILLVYNHRPGWTYIEEGKAIAQFVLLPFLVCDDEIPPTEVRSGGFGSTDVRV